MSKKLFISLFIALALPLVANAQWLSDSTKNTPICKASGTQQNIKMISDGDDGAIIIWEDYRRASGIWDLYAQRIDKNGYTKWTSDGVLLSNGTAAAPKGNNSAQKAQICTDGNGGAYVVWEDKRWSTKYATKLYAQRILADGTLGYKAGGILLCDTLKQDQINAAICEDGSGNAYVAWEDYRSTISPSSSIPDIYMNRLTPSGITWGQYATAVITQGADQKNVRLCNDGQGGCFLVWTTNFGGTPISIYGTRISSSGTVLWGTQGYGVVINKADYYTKNAANPVITRDGTDLIVAWEEPQISSSQGIEVMVMRMGNDGSKRWASPNNPTALAAGDQTHAIAFSDNAPGSPSGVLVAYESYAGTRDIGVTRIGGDGNAISPSPNTIYPVCNLAYDQSAPVGVKLYNGMLLAWVDARAGGTQTSIYAQVVDTTPVRKLWPSNSASTSRWGLPVSISATGGIKDQLAIAPRSSGAILAWRDERGATSGYDVYAQLVFANGTLPIELSSFTLKKHSGNAVSIDWKTATEKDNAGFEIERRAISEPNSDNAFEVVASYRNTADLRGTINSNIQRSYSYLDIPGKAGFYEYRLVDFALDGSHTTHDIKSIEVGDASDAASWSVDPNSPNPFQDQTSITFSSPVRAIVDVEVYDMLGRTISTPMKASLLDAGLHRVSVRSSELGAAGSFYYSIIAHDAETGALIWKMPKAAMMLKLK